MGVDMWIFCNMNWKKNCRYCSGFVVVFDGKHEIIMGSGA